MDYNPSMTNSSRHSTLLSAQSRLRVLGASKKQAFPSPDLFVSRPFCPTAFLSTGLLVLDLLHARGVYICSSVCLFVCLFVCLSPNCKNAIFSKTKQFKAMVFIDDL